MWKRKILLHLQMTSTKPYLRKKAVLIMYKVFLRFPEALRPAFPRLKEKLEDPDPGEWHEAPSILGGRFHGVWGSDPYQKCCPWVWFSGMLIVKSSPMTYIMVLQRTFSKIALRVKRNHERFKNRNHNIVSDIVDQYSRLTVNNDATLLGID